MIKLFNYIMNKVDLISLFVLSLSIILLGYVTYRAEYVYEGNLESYYSTYYLFSYICLFASVTFIFFSKSLKKIIITLLSSLVIAFYMVEGGLLIIKNYEIKMKSKKEKNEIQYKTKEFKKTNQTYDTREVLEVFKDLKSKNLNVTVAFTPTTLKINDDKVIFPLSSTSSHITTIDCNENGYYSKYLSDRYGYNNPDSEWDKNEHILLIGDSFVNGSCVNEVDTISSNLRNLIKKKNNTAVLNLGVGNTGPLIHFAIFKEYLKKIKPKKVFWFYYEGNDLDNLKDELENSILKRYLHEENFVQNVAMYQNEIDKVYLETVNSAFNSKKDYRLKTQQNSQKKLIFRILTFDLVRKSIKQFLYTPPISELNSILLEAKRLANEYNTELNIVYLPGYYRYENNGKKNTLNLSNYKKILTMFESLNLNIIDIKTELDKHEDVYSLFPFRIHGHFNPEGTAFVSKVIFNKSFNNQ